MASRSTRCSRAPHGSAATGLSEILSACQKFVCSSGLTDHVLGVQVVAFPSARFGSGSGERRRVHRSRHAGSLVRTATGIPGFTGTARWTTVHAKRVQRLAASSRSRFPGRFTMAITSQVADIDGSRTRICRASRSRSGRGRRARPPVGEWGPGVAAGVGAVMRVGVLLDAHARTDPPHRLTAQVRCRIRPTGRLTTNPFWGFPRRGTARFFLSWRWG
jgi:hypothetical protein